MTPVQIEVIRYIGIFLPIALGVVGLWVIIAWIFAARRWERETEDAEQK